MRVWVLALWLVAGCEGDLSSGGDPVDGGARHDAGAHIDASGPADAGGVDAGAFDGGPPPHDAGPPAPTDAGAPPTDAGAPALARRDGCFHTIASAGDRARIDFGEVGTEYGTITIEVDLITGSWREDLYDREILNHNAINVFRNAPVSRERYIGGLGAQIRPMDPGLARTTLFFARVDLEERPPGMGYTSYTTFRSRAPWRTDTRYHVSMTFDAVAHRQVLDVTSPDGTELSHVEGAIAYFVPSLTSSGWYVELGADETEHRDVSPVGWQYCDLVVRGE